MKLNQLLEFVSIKDLTGDLGIEITGISDDSRYVKPGDLFIAVRGNGTDGHQFVQSAVEKGAIAVLCETRKTHENVVQICVENTQSILLTIALRFFGNPEKTMKLVGVTGTNGKTTVSTLIYELLRGLGYTVGLIGTVSKRIGSEVIESKLTTPGAIELAKDLQKMAAAGCSHVIMETSSHALKQNRVKGLHYDVAIFTNLTRDHLDYHGTVEDYASSKQILFNSLSSESVAIVNADDSFFETMVAQTQATVWEVSLQKGSGAVILQNNADGLVIDLDGMHLHSTLSGVFNAYNIIQAYLACIALGANQHGLALVLENCKGAAGRLEKVQIPVESEYPYVFVDYAHTPDALENVAKTLKGIQKEGQDLIIVFGCGGNRDSGKRPIMAGIAENYATKVIITSDNPRFEDPELILDDVEKGFTKKSNFVRITDRKTAIETSISQSKTNSLILIAGKGHENYQEIKGIRYPMDDKLIAIETLMQKFSPKAELAGKGVSNVI
jgi:UDP-N-acetylmuramoyl-L-alanyl-D-glutamate--2,6-diaminopimelate ligase